jgi:LPXTG-site transpeptidase (sortase) family protein
MTPTDDVRIDPEITTLSRWLSRRSLLRTGGLAATMFALAGARSWAAPLAPFGEAPVNPWEDGGCDDAQTSGDGDFGEADGDAAEAVIIPFQLLIPAVNIDARVEILEIVEGALQDPSNGEDVAWYKETARVGEEGNAVFAGHLNWYGMPEAVFFAIDKLKLDDEIRVRDGSCMEHRYLVEWVELVEVATADMDEITGQTEDAMLTLITCGGSWDPAIGQYKQRTVVRARLADSNPGESAAAQENEVSGPPDESPAIVARDGD